MHVKIVGRMFMNAATVLFTYYAQCDVTSVLP